MQKCKTDEGSSDDGKLLACGLPADEHAAMSWRSNLSKVDRNATKFHTGREALQQASQENQDRCDKANACKAWSCGNRKRADAHQREGEKQSRSTAVAIRITPQNN